MHVAMGMHVAHDLDGGIDDDETLGGCEGGGVGGIAQFVEGEVTAGGFTTWGGRTGEVVTEVFCCFAVIDGAALLVGAVRARVTFCGTRGSEKEEEEEEEEGHGREGWMGEGHVCRWRGGDDERSIPMAKVDEHSGQQGLRGAVYDIYDADDDEKGRCLSLGGDQEGSVSNGMSVCVFVLRIDNCENNCF